MDSQGRPIIKSISEGKPVITSSTPIMKENSHYKIIERMLQQGPVPLHKIVSRLKKMGIHTVSKSTTSTSTKAMKMGKQIRQLGFQVQALPGNESEMYCYPKLEQKTSPLDLKKKSAKERQSQKQELKIRLLTIVAQLQHNLDEMEPLVAFSTKNRQQWLHFIQTARLAGVGNDPKRHTKETLQRFRNSIHRHAPSSTSGREVQETQESKRTEESRRERRKRINHDLEEADPIKLKVHLILEVKSMKVENNAQIIEMLGDSMDIANICAMLKDPLLLKLKVQQAQKILNNQFLDVVKDDETRELMTTINKILQQRTMPVEISFVIRALSKQGFTFERRHHGFLLTPAQQIAALGYNVELKRKGDSYLLFCWPCRHGFL